MKAQTLNVDRVPAPIRTDTDLSPRETDEISLISGGLFRMDVRRAGAAILCLQGDCWITQEGDAGDYRLITGETFRVSRRGRVIVQAMRGGAQVRVA
ncbi:hypothetical protein CCAX7_31670 [Capsulimonas corticalis]|uniref:Uncharacterized protein n=1 Tax=Capsulimonas corticalis TaxID=2219043 RepID=A0A402CSE8_9BACT|nr:DUF2917 domain-containing protein [Capsulimonas corticalis]BDI31116.1 hypothetical protein CCAX7_31670 [Capsulimonas corticalis]